jgi:hypothetical protein
LTSSSAVSISVCSAVMVCSSFDRVLERAALG